MACTILVVEDDEPVLSTLKLVLESKKNIVSTAISAAQARKLLNSYSFDVVLTDMRMESDTSGFDVAREAKKQKHAPAVVILTAFPLLAREWKAAGADAMLAKPIAIGDLLRVIESVLQRRRGLRHPESNAFR